MDWSILNFNAMRELYNLHPMWVHFPVALLPSALLLYVLAHLLKRPSLGASARICLYLGTLGSVAAAISGWLGESSIPHNETIHHMMQTHKMTGIGVAVVFLLLSAMSYRKFDVEGKLRWVFYSVLLFGNVFVALNADLGARMVYVEGAGVKAAVPAVSEGHDHGAHEH